MVSHGPSVTKWLYETEGHGFESRQARLVLTHDTCTIVGRHHQPPFFRARGVAAGPTRDIKFGLGPREVAALDRMS